MGHSKGKSVFELQMLLPSLVIMVIVQIIPIAIGVFYSLHSLRVYEVENKFVGLYNYMHLLSQSHFFKIVIPNTLLYTVVTTSIQVIMGVAIALLLKGAFKGKSVVISLILLPLMIAPVIVGLIFVWMLNDQFGIVNELFSIIGLPRIAWLSGRWTAMSAIIVASTWEFTPWVAIISLAALEVQPPEPEESAMLDGANRWQIFRYVTLPYLSPVISVCLLIRVFDEFRQFDLVWSMTKGGPARATELFGVYAYKESSVYFHYGMGLSASILGAVVIMLFGLIVYRTFRKLAEF